MANIEMDISALPELIGTEKQIAWAEKIRLSMIEEIERYVERYKDGIVATREAGKDTSMTPQALNRTFYRILDNEQAIWWIEHRSDSPQLLFHKMLRK